MGNSKRYEIVDELRGFAVFLMIIYHFCYNLNHFKFISVDLFKNPFWWTFPRVIVFLFMFVMGISLTLAHRNSTIHYRAYLRRLAKLIIAAALVSLITYFLFPSRWVYFGTLHCLALNSILVLYLTRYPKLSGILGIAIIFPWVFGYEYPWPKLGHQSMDYIPSLPWVGITLLGIFSTALKLQELTLPLPKRCSRGLKVLGRHSLLIYLMHQPILFGLIYGMKTLIK